MQTPSFLVFQLSLPFLWEMTQAFIRLREAHWKTLLETRCQKSILRGKGGGSYKKRASCPGHCDKYNVQKDAEEEGKRAVCVNLNDLFRAFRPALATWHQQDGIYNGTQIQNNISIFNIQLSCKFSLLVFCSPTRSGFLIAKFYNHPEASIFCPLHHCW